VERNVKNISVDVLGIQKITNPKGTSVYEFRFGRFDYVSNSLQFNQSKDLNEVNIRKFAKFVCSTQEQRVKVEIKEEKGRATNVSFKVRAGDKVVKKHALIPTSLIYQAVSNGKIEHFAPPWIINQKLKDAAEFAQAQRLNTMLDWNPELATIDEEEVFTWALEKLGPEIAKAKEAEEIWLRQRKIDDEKRAVASAADKVRAAAKAAEEAKKAEQAAARKAKRVPDQVFTNAHVKWVEWVDDKKMEREAFGCRVEFYGKKREITRQNGKQFVKMEGNNLVIVEVPLS